ncbi:hypothetical protein BKP45_11545 [Anaerobacillus alkalidiazotrophicus]|uniref:Uncharacterized protein n=1 Tax=Anaerobacillus alkalidiazotrophicus TaxID=472963 RepID=A0A1S2M4U8_9BACI|nr:hypothetical protein [Anaerobacillus alkalidiazotrophicus]OIJ18212.1 hypothetical protein BKP45_17260 [Anaerobacillus alkalidiazotrophicus]OIJ19691.1 hypothetical protein BKP45_11545 [Anaerobacillus alkalidiazotrophicus]
MRIILAKISIVLIFLFLTGCTVTKEQAVETAKNSFESGVISEPREPNNETELFNYYLPPGLNIEEEAGNNLILNRGEQIFIIFSNPAEDFTSQVNFEQDKIVEDKAILIETIEVEGTFNYIIVAPFDNDKYKVILGSGGEKGTTITELSNIKDSVETLVEIIRSVSY